VLGFTMGPFGNIERPWKPFNPILGETFEYAKPTKGMKFIAEQVRFFVVVWHNGTSISCLRDSAGLSDSSNLTDGLALPAPALGMPSAWRCVDIWAHGCMPFYCYPLPVPCAAVQVSHHPPVGAAHAETDLWTFDQVRCAAAFALAVHL